jgi:hypothetical protein
MPWGGRLTSSTGQVWGAAVDAEVDPVPLVVVSGAVVVVSPADDASNPSCGMPVGEKKMKMHQHFQFTFE